MIMRLRVRMGTSELRALASSRTTKCGITSRVGVKTPTLAAFPFLVLAAVCATAVSVHAQSSGSTVRHHRIEVKDDAAGLLTQAENSIEKQDYASAEPLLKKYIDSHSDSYVAWYDLGFLYHKLGKNEDSVAAY